MKPWEGYWLNALKNHKKLKYYITKNDENILKHLIKIEYKTFNSDDFCLNFHFSPNEYLETSIIIMAFKFDSEGYCKLAECNTIKWKTGKQNKNESIRDSTESKDNKYQEGTFFNFFKTVKLGSKDVNFKGTQDDVAFFEIEDHLEIAYNIVDDILAYHFEFYTGIFKKRPDDSDEENEEDQWMEDSEDEDESTKHGKEGKKDTKKRHCRRK